MLNPSARRLTWPFRVGSAALLLLLPFVPWAADAQILRGSVTERGTARPLSGVVLSVLDSAGQPAAGALSEEDGSFEIRLPAPGTYSIEAKRIGVRLVRPPPFTIAEGEVKRVEIELEAVAFALESMRITGRSACVQRPQENARTAALWEEARAALTATVLTRRGPSTSDSVVRFRRKLDALNWKVLFEERRRVAASIDRPFRSVSAASLSDSGFVRMRPDSSADYYAPDAEVLLSDRFLADHCFRVQGGIGESSRYVGLAFEPIPGRVTPDVRGVLWIDARSAELRSLEFTYTWLPHELRPGDFGGRVGFLRTPGGRWIVQSWRIRTPEFGFEQWAEAADGRRIPRGRSWAPVVVRIMEEGGAVPVGTLLLETGTVAGTVVLDTIANRPFPGVTVSLLGAADETTTNRDGDFLMRWVTPGSYTVLLRHTALDSLGLVHSAATIDVAPRSNAMLQLSFPGTAAIARQLCGEALSLDHQSVVRFIVVDSVTGRAMAREVVRVTQHQRIEVDGVTVDSVAKLHDGAIDDEGAVLACGIPRGAIVVIEGLRRNGRTWSTITTPAVGVVGWLVVRVGR